MSIKEICLLNLKTHRKNLSTASVYFVVIEVETMILRSKDEAIIFMCNTGLYNRKI